MYGEPSSWNTATVANAKHLIGAMSLQDIGQLNVEETDTIIALSDVDLTTELVC